MTRPALLRFVVLVLLCGAGAAIPASAQDRLFIGTGEIGTAGRFGERIGAAPGAVYGLLVDGGRIVVDGALAFDTRTGRVLTVIEGRVLAGDPAQPRLFVHDGQTITTYHLDPAFVTPLVPAQAPTAFSTVSAQYAPDAGLLFVHRAAPGGGSEMAVVDVTSARVVRTIPSLGWAAADWSVSPDALPNVQAGLFDWSVSPDGRRVVANVWSANPALYPSGLLLIDAESGAVLSSQPPRRLSLGPETLVADRRFERSYLLGRSELAAFDDGLQLLGAIAVRSTCASPTMAVSPHTGRIYVVDSVGGGQFYGQPVPIQHYLSVYDGATGRFVDSREITAAAGVPAGSNSCGSLPIKVVTAPGPPRQLVAAVTGRDLTLSWSDGGGITSDYVLEVGLVAGQTVATITLGRRPAATFTQVPPGRYTARMRAVNPFGVSRPSNEVTILVP